MIVIQVPITDLIPYVNNSRTHDDKQVDQIAASIREFGFTNPILIDENNSIIAGHGRLQAAKKLKLTEVPCIVLEGLSEAQKKAYVIADNKLALNAGWNLDLLRVEIEALNELDFDVSLIGFDAEELNALIPEEIPPGLTDEDEVPEPPKEPKTQLGDIWILGNHRLMCGDSTSIDAVDRLLSGAAVDMVYTDPPYGINIVGKNGKIGGGKLAKNGVYAPIAGDESIDVAKETIQIIKTLSADIEIIWGGNYYANNLNNSSCWIVWDKENTGDFADAELAWTNQKTATRIFKHQWNGMIKASEHGKKRVHPTQKPIALAEWCIDQYGDGCEAVLDLFGGSGSTLIACETRKRRGFIMELAPAYCDVIIKRWQDYTGKQAILESTGKTYNES